MKKLLTLSLLAISFIVFASTALNGNGTLSSLSSLLDLNEINNMTTANNILSEPLGFQNEITADDLNAKFKALDYKIGVISAGTGQITGCSSLSASHDIAGNDVSGDLSLTACVHNKDFFTPSCLISSSGLCTSSCGQDEVISGFNCIPFVAGLAQWNTTGTETLVSPSPSDTLNVTFPATGDVSVAFTHQRGSTGTFMIGFGELGSNIGWTPRDTFALQINGSNIRLNPYDVQATNIATGASSFDNSTLVNSSINQEVEYRISFINRDTTPTMEFYIDNVIVHSSGVTGLDGELHFFIAISSAPVNPVTITNVVGNN